MDDFEILQAGIIDQDLDDGMVECYFSSGQEFRFFRVVVVY